MIIRKLRSYRQPLMAMWRYGGAQRKLIGAFLLLGIFGTLTESFGVFLLIPLLQTMGQNNIFADTPLLGPISRFFEALPSDFRLIWAAVIMLVVVLLRGAVQFTTDFVGYSIPHRVDFDLRLRAYRVLLNTSMKFVDTLGAGELSNYIVAHPARAGISLRFLATLISSIVVLFSYIIIITIVAPSVFFVALIYAICATLVYRRLSTPFVHKVGRELTEANQKFSQIFYETLSGAKLIRLAGATTAIQGDVERTTRALQRAMDRQVAMDNCVVPFFSTIGGILICVLVMMVGLLNAAMAGRAVGLLIIFFILIFRILGPLSLISISRNNIIPHLEVFDGLDKFYAMAEKAFEPDGHLNLDTFKKTITLQNVSFSYSVERAEVLSDVSLEIKQGQMVAFVGVTGSGKSTLISLIARLYRPDSGRILVDGIDLNDLAVETWWRRLSVVTQDAILTNDTIKANLCLGLHTEVSEEQMRAAAKLAAIDDWIESLPEGYKTKLGDRGSRLSGGQRQRIVLARAFLRNADILILDEATSALDALTERAIQKQLLELMRQKTLIVIAHRLSTVRRADVIFVVERGRIIETGSHNQLIGRRGIYWEMIQSQSLDLIEDEDQPQIALVG